MVNHRPQDKCPPDTAIVFAVTLWRCRRSEPWAGNAATGTTNHDTIRTQRSLHPTRAGGNVRASG